MGDNTIHYSGHVQMMGAVQPFISGAISKTVNMPEDVTVEEVEQLHIDAWKLGIKAVAIYRDNCKVAQPLVDGQEGRRRRRRSPRPRPPRSSRSSSGSSRRSSRSRPAQKLPRNRTSRTFEFRVADCKGFVTVGEYEDGRPGEIFMRVSKQGSTLAGIMDAFAISISYGLQYGVPLRAFVETFTNMRFEPAGMTDDPDIRFATSLLDYIFRRLAVDYLSLEERAELGILTIGERTQPTLPGVEETVIETRQGTDIAADPPVDRVGVARCLPTLRRPDGGQQRRAPPAPPAQGAPRRRPVLHAVRRPDAAGRLLPRLPQLRHHQRLQLAPSTLLQSQGRRPSPQLTAGGRWSQPRPAWSQNPYVPSSRSSSRGVDEAADRGPGEPAADRHAAHPDRRELGDRGGSLRARTFTGRSTSDTSVRISSRLLMPGA